MVGSNPETCKIYFNKTGYFVSLIENGYIYIAQPPLFRVQKGKEIRYAYNEKEKDRIMDEIEKLSGGKKKEEKKEKEIENEDENEGEETVEIKRSGASIQRYKGLGEMNPDQLWETTMNVDSRQLKQVGIADAVEADKLFDILMGEEVEPRKKFIQTHATAVKNLDI